MVLMIKQIVTDLFCVLVVVCLILYSHIRMKPVQRGFFCDDESIRYPYEPSTISLLLLTAVGFLIPAAIMTGVEIVYTRQSTPSMLRGTRIPTWVVSVYHKVGTFFFGGLITMGFTEIAKFSIGRLRPHFIDVCQPDIDCQNPSNLNKYHVNFECKNTDKQLLGDARKSFLSGHSSFAMYTMIYFVLYLELRMTWKGSRVLRHFLQAVCLGLAWFTALSRVSDHMHHWSDVLAGMCLGSVIALVHVFYVANFFEERQTICEENNPSNRRSNRELHERSHVPII